MIQCLGRMLLFVANSLELLVFTVLMYLATYLPANLCTWYPRLFQVWCRAFIRTLGVDLRLHQKHEKPLPKQYILIANHPSAFEDVGVPALFPVYCLAKVQVKDWFIAGRISQAAGTLYLEREDKSSRTAARSLILDELAQGKNICVYPEGGCIRRRLSPFLYGIFELSLESGVPIVPVFLQYEAQEDFEWLEESLPLKIWQIMNASNKRANYYVFDAFYPQDFSDKKAYCEQVYQQCLQWQSCYLE